MTEKVRISVPDDAVTHLQSQSQGSGAVHRGLPEARRARQRAAARAYGDYLRPRSAELADDEAALIDASNEISLRGAEW
jgi:hypothetical protein